MAIPCALVLTGYGINCDEETAYAFERAGARAEIVHINDLIDKHRDLDSYQILVFPGGFSFGDDTGSGNALAFRIRNNLWEGVQGFVEKDKLMIGICNGFQVMANLGLLPALDGKYGIRQMALAHNDSARYIDRWVDLEVNPNSPWTRGISEISLPVAHGEGRFYAEPTVLEAIKQRGLVAARYVSGEVCRHQRLQPNPNGSLEDIAGIFDASRRCFGLMPHPERAIAFTQLPYWPFIKENLKRKGFKLPDDGPGLQIFKNGVKYFE